MKDSFLRSARASMESTQSRVTREETDLLVQTPAKSLFLSCVIPHLTLGHVQATKEKLLAKICRVAEKRKSHEVRLNLVFISDQVLILAQSTLQ